MSFFSGDNLRAITGGRWVQRSQKEVESLGIATDSRGDLAGKVFVAIRGDRFDGHDFLSAAAEHGAVLALVDRDLSPEAIPAGIGVVRVADTRKALAQIALRYRRSLTTTKVIAVTGSCGKTTTKHLIHEVLRTSLRGTVAPRSFNNEIGVPLTILEARPNDRYLIVEIGTNSPGEVSQLSKITEPDIAVVTSIGRSHLDGFGSVREVAKEKASLFAHLRAGGIAVVNAAAAQLDPYLRTLETVIRFGESDTADLRLTDRGAADNHWWFEINRRIRFELGLPGRHNALNALAAVAIGRRFGLDDERIGRALAEAEPMPMRMTTHEIGGIRLFNDAYNANPDSMLAAIETFDEVSADASRRVLVLGDMLELGPEAATLHREIGRHIEALHARRRFDEIIFVGEMVRYADEVVQSGVVAARCVLYSHLDQSAIEGITRALRPGDAVLLKASRGIALERVLSALEQTVTPSEGTETRIEITGRSPTTRAGTAG